MPLQPRSLWKLNQWRLPPGVLSWRCICLRLFAFELQFEVLEQLVGWQMMESKRQTRKKSHDKPCNDDIWWTDWSFSPTLSTSAKPQSLPCSTPPSLSRVRQVKAQAKAPVKPGMSHPIVARMLLPPRRVWWKQLWQSRRDEIQLKCARECWPLLERRGSVRGGLTFGEDKEGKEVSHRNSFQKDGLRKG